MMPGRFPCAPLAGFGRMRRRANTSRFQPAEQLEPRWTLDPLAVRQPRMAHRQRHRRSYPLQDSTVEVVVPDFPVPTHPHLKPLTPGEIWQPTGWHLTIGFFTPGVETFSQ